ncbi:hypothetical protein AAFF_G00294950 [Aldrovandia affinis]|uniref:Uncharacterized protein n=1 Tax=Aldrovandia affinis TaxID=143900 RepID=A0AAD7R8W0_9TELE|nr:hypothetical protein AAFF_G00294950 [Aldrovandia affinis]
MASKLLDRLRRTLLREGSVSAELGGAECPESSELEDDTESVSARLSGTLSFEGERMPESEDADDTSAPDSDSDFLVESVENGSCSTEGSPGAPLPPGAPPAQGPQGPRLARGPARPGAPLPPHSLREKLLFEVTDATVVQEAASKYVLYTIHFFYLGDLRAGQALLRAGRAQDALAFFLNALLLQERLGCQEQHQQRAHWLYTLLALVTCYQDLEQLDEAQEHCDRALNHLAPAPHLAPSQDPALPGPRPPLPRPSPSPRPQDRLQQQLHPLLIPLLQTNVRLSWKISKDKRKWEALLLEIQDSGADTANQPSLKEYLVKEVLEDHEGDPKPRVKGHHST